MPNLTLSIASIGTKGDGVARHEGASLFLPYTLPGEVVRVAMEEGRPRLIALEEASPARIHPICPHFTQCGGCAVQHWQAEGVAAWKRARIITALERVGLSPDVAQTRDAHGAGRRRVTLHIRACGDKVDTGLSPESMRHEKKDGAFAQACGDKGNAGLSPESMRHEKNDSAVEAGFMRARTHDLINLDACPLLVPALDQAPDLAREIGAILIKLKKPLDLQVTASAVGLDLDIRGAGPISEAQRQALVAFATRHDLARLTLHGTRVMEVRAPFILFPDTQITAFLPPGSFLQPTALGEETLASLAFEGLSGAKHVADLFCGLGPFALRLARAMKVHAFDADNPAIEALQRSIRANPGARPLVAEARDLFRRPLFVPELATFDAALLDPPRQGAEAQTREIARSKLARVVYVSCDPESFARDARVLVDAGFAITRLTPVDQFRFSAHVELVAVFSKAKRG